MDRDLPIASIEAEEAILGQVLFQPKLIAELEKILPAKAFYVPAHESIYQAMLTVHHNKQTPDFIHLIIYLQSKDLLDSVGGMARLVKLQNCTISATNYDRYTMLVLGKYRRRRLIAMANEVINLASDQTMSFEDCTESIKKLIDVEFPGEPDYDRQPEIQQVKYTFRSKSGREEMELLADIRTDQNIIEDISKLRNRCDALSREVWQERLIE